MSQSFAGIDPGLEGAVALIYPEGNIVQTWDTPTLLVHGKKNRREYDLSEMKMILAILCEVKAFVLIEQVHSMPKQGVSSSFTFGRGFGLWEGLLVGMGLAYERVTPQRWKKILLDGMQHGKGASIVVAKRLFPAVDLHRAKDHGKADAIMLAEYGRRTSGLRGE